MDGWRNLHSDVLHNLYFSPNFITMIEVRQSKRERYVVVFA
jgi:hypothetical protein